VAVRGRSAGTGEPAARSAAPFPADRAAALGTPDDIPRDTSTGEPGEPRAGPPPARRPRPPRHACLGRADHRGDGDRPELQHRRGPCPVAPGPHPSTKPRSPTRRHPIGTTSATSSRTAHQKETDEHDGRAARSRPRDRTGPPGRSRRALGLPPYGASRRPSDHNREPSTGCRGSATGARWGAPASEPPPTHRRSGRGHSPDRRDDHLAGRRDRPPGRRHPRRRRPARPRRRRRDRRTGPRRRTRPAPAHHDRRGDQLGRSTCGRHGHHLAGPNDDRAMDPR